MSSNPNNESAPAFNGDPSRPERGGRKIIIPAAAALVALALILYGIGTRRGKEVDVAAACPATWGLVQKLKPLVHGEVAALTLAAKPAPLPPLSFSGSDGKTVTLADFRGRDVLLNLWATWCVPCRQEMPALDRLEAKLGGQDFEVVAINIDTARLERPKAFLNEIGVRSLRFYSDSKADVFQVLKQDRKLLGLPTTILIGKDGCEIGTLAGPAQWDSEDALTLLTAVKG
ncbi:MAG: thiol:disulfide interchange protein TlpA [Beijerinckiaceae bacterium]